MIVEPKGAPTLTLTADPYTLLVMRLLGLLDKYEAAKDDDERTKVLNMAWRQLWATPREFVQGLAILGNFNFTLDLCAEAHTAKCSRYLGPGSDIAEDAFSVDWGDLLNGGHGWCNMPFANVSGWVDGMVGATGEYVMIAPDRTDQAWWHLLKHSSFCHETFVRGRPKFIPPAGVKSSGPAGGVAIWVIGHSKRRLPECVERDAVLMLGRQACADIDGADGGSRE
jgi:phage N-6-adenine-methyltransferase